MTTIKPIGFSINKLLRKNNLSYQDLSDKTGVSKPYLAEIITKNRVPSKEKIEKIAKVFELDPFYFREYRLILLNEHIEKNPHLLAYDNYEDLKQSVDLSQTMEKLIRLTDEADNYREYLSETELMEAERYQKLVNNERNLYKFFVNALNEVDVDNLDEDDIEAVNTIVKRLSEKSKK